VANNSAGTPCGFRVKYNDISTGFGHGTYRPSIVVTRQAMSAFMYRVSLLP
jgi:hypothetical protein